MLYLHTPVFPNLKWYCSYSEEEVVISMPQEEWEAGPLGHLTQDILDGPMKTGRHEASENWYEEAEWFFQQHRWFVHDNGVDSEVTVFEFLPLFCPPLDKSDPIVFEFALGIMDPKVRFGGKAK